MIERILINNSPAFELLDININPGFNVFSGASGAGKSVLMDSLLAMFGIKDSNADLIEVNINTSQIDTIKENLEEFGILDSGDDLVLSILKKDKVRYFINHQASSKKRLNDLIMGFGIHISNKNAQELQSENLLNILDKAISSSSPAHSELLLRYKSAYLELKEESAKLSKLEQEEKDIENLKEMAIFEISKIESANIKSGEYDKLLEQKKKLSKLDKISSEIQKVKLALDGFDTIESFLAMLDKKSDILNESRIQVEEILSSAEEEISILNDMDASALLDKISLLGELIRKYGSEEEALKRLDTQKAKLEEWENITFSKDKLLKHIASLQDEIQKDAKQIHTNREKYLPTFNAKLQDLATSLLLKDTALILRIDSINPLGSDVCDILVSKSNISTLSSGEFNRLRLAIMALGSEYISNAKVMILDEIDANLSGQESEGVAKILKKLSSSYQIFAISHQAHMPSLADNHYLIEKMPNGKASLTHLDTQGRIKEIARMISGADITKEAMDFAKSVLDKNGIN